MTGQTAAYLPFGRELRLPDDVAQNLQAIHTSEGFIPKLKFFKKPKKIEDKQVNTVTVGCLNKVKTKSL